MFLWWPAGRALDAPSQTLGAGEAIYRTGVLPAGKPVAATNAAGTEIRGAAAACVNCHRRSGLGSREGQSLIPPITGRYLFRPRGGGPGPDVGYVESYRGEREPYTDATLARAIREGVNSEGKPLKPLMPRFEINDADTAMLTDYLKSLDARHVPGVTEKILHFATVITPDADPVKRRAMLAVLEQYVAERNARQMTPVPRIRGAHAFMVHRRWELHVWDLKGEPTTWQDQLRQRLKQEPVFALVSGLAGRTWAPVQAFCEQEALPCLFPNVEAPVDGQRDFYSLYFSRGVFLEADLIAKAIADAGVKPPAVVRQVYRAGDVGEAAADALAARLAQLGIKTTRSVLPAGEPGTGLPKALQGVAETGALVLWLRPADLAALGEASTAPARVYLSGLMGGQEYAPLAPAWRERSHLAYPFDLPERRRVRVDFAMGWFSIRRIPVEDVRLQADTYLACGLLSETINHMADTFVRPYLVERVEDMVDHRVITGYYPRLTLASGQRFASKGGYMVRFAEPKGTKIVAETDWVVPTFDRVRTSAALP
ncbi:MAG TPA: c-type cytochrome [Burkholderiaceae bacterium]|nr:c-type cytochrome [Burkholderiaceae bacterium]